MIGLSLVSMIWLRGMINAAPQTTEPTSSPTRMPLSREDEDAVEKQGPATPKLKRTLSHGPSLRDELADIVRQDPDAAADILRTWIGKAG